MDLVAMLIVNHALVISHLDYCIMLYMGLSLKTPQKLKLVQIAAAHIMLGNLCYTAAV